MRLKKLTAIVICFFLFTSIILTSNFKVQAASISSLYFTADSNIKVGQEFNIYVNAESILDLYGASIDLKYDTNMIKVNSVQVGTAFDGLVSTSSSGNDYFTLSNIDQTNGTLSIAATLMGNTHAVGLDITTAKSIFIIKATALKAGNFNLNFVSSTPVFTSSTANCQAKLSDSASRNMLSSTYYYSILTSNLTVPVASPNNADIISDTIPTTMEAGRSYTVSVTTKNTGSNTWTYNNNYKLGAVGDSDPFYGIGVTYPRVLMATTDSIAPGNTKTFTFTMTAPSTPGAYTTDWQMAQDGVEWFGAKLVKNVTVIHTNPNDAAIVSDTIPTTMEAGKSYTVSVTTKNTGSNTWTFNNNYKLGAVGDSDPFYGIGATYPRVLMGITDSVPTGNTKIFTFTMTAPSTPGSYTTDWQMAQDGVEWFGAKLVKNVTVIHTNPNDAAIVSDTIPTTMEAGKSYTVSVTTKNTGSNNWTFNNNYKLGAVGDSDPFYGIGITYPRVLMGVSDSIAPGNTKTFTFTMTAPSTPSSYTTDWQMAQDGVEWFGAKLVKSVTVTKSTAINDASVVSDTIPATMEAGKSYTVSVTTKNTGSTTWTYNNNYKLGAAGDSDPFYGIGITYPRVLMGVSDSIAPGSTKTFTFTMTAPSTPGAYTTDWQMAQDGVEWFGAKLVKGVTVTKSTAINDASIVSDTIPATMEAGKSYTVSVTTKNTGSTTWTYNNNYKLGAAGDSDPFYGIGVTYPRILMGASDSIAPGNTKTFTFTMTAPSTPGAYTTDWQMAQDGVEWFGAKLVKTVTVTSKLAANDAVIVNDTIPTIMEAGKSYTVTVTTKNTGSNTWTYNNNYKLGSAGDSDPFYGIGVTYPRILMATTDSIANGNTKTFTFTMTAPSTAGTYTTDWQMAQDGVEWFGAKLVKTVTVTTNKLVANDAVIVSDTIPTSMEAGKSYTVTVTTKNTGSNTWTYINNYKLGAAGDSDPFYGIGVTYPRVLMATTDSITSGNTKTFTFTMTAPSTPGVYTSDWQMAQDGVEWFGAKLIRTITVK